jgi:uncharacterized damage-inducible protein DinB
MTVMEYVAQQTVRMAEALAHFVQTTNQDRLGWQPAAENGSETRSALDQVNECIHTNRLVAAVLRGEEISTANLQGSAPTTRPAEPADVNELLKQLLASAEELAAAIRGISEEDMDRIYNHPRAQMRGQNMILICYRNMAYHAGQINFIQTLYGDHEFHVPPNWR